MTFDERATSLQHGDIVALLVENDELRRQLAWFQRQLFGTKSERLLVSADPRQLMLGELASPAAPVPTRGIQAYRRRIAHSREDDGDGGHRFDASVPVEVVEEPLPDGVNPETHEIVGEKVTDRLAQRPGTYVVIRHVRKVVKRKSDGRLLCSPAPPAVLDRCIADVSLLAGMVIDKLVYHLPLYRQHQRMEAAGVHLARADLTNWMHGVGELLVPVYRAQVASVIAGHVATMDETPIRAGRDRPGRMKRGYFWPVYGDRDEVIFPFSESRSGAIVRETLQGFTGALVTDGYEVYEKYARTVNGLVHAQCWSHTRRNFEAALEATPLCLEALERIAKVYEHEATMRKRDLSPEKRLAYRGEHTAPEVARFFEWLRTAVAENLLVPSHPFLKAANYALDREANLKVFLEYPDVPIDTNHLEREIRPVALGRRNWLFCWTEIGAKYVGVLQSLLATCRLQGVDPYTYLVDVLQRIDSHPQSRVHELTPRLWKDHFASNPLRSHVDRVPRPNAVP
ncbi:MAG TPA: IS66 family transposase [Candidatus Methylomirabilis sp.]|nr:IS66 family transposase [Candidatus Methylomirabilis sp.]